MTTILLVDDDPTFLEPMCTALSAQGYSVHKTNDGQEAKAVLKAQKFDLLITDILMTTMNGLDLIDCAISSNMDIRILAVSGGGENDNGIQLLSEAMECGADGILQKPFPPAELIRTVKAIL